MLQAGNGLEAIEAFDNEGGRVDLVISNVVMPAMDGVTLLKEIRRRSPKLSVLLISGFAEEMIDRNLPVDEPLAFLAKPFTITQLLGAMSELLDQQM